ncbi:protein GRIM REAPER-like [Gastrolobium bilobum]|uniref:protein GRIM REAPER-like n=1 Tax=Gastrolobium bilobum TaxID=150636 RepID=UPI002AB20FEF|nr:protein GRIM REAPER-like [Gastrolobium bilobum]
MAKMLFKLTTVLSLLITLSLHCQMAFSTTNIHGDDDDSDEEYYELDTPLSHFTSRSRFLATTIKKGAHCNPTDYKICNGVSAKKGTQLLQCCKKKCVNVLGDMNHCGWCGKKCKQGERCCNGVCTNILYNVHNCGKCDKKCKHGTPCWIGFCGYA